MNRFIYHIILFQLLVCPVLTRSQDDVLYWNNTVIKPIEFLKGEQSSNKVGFKFQDSRGFIWGVDRFNRPMRFDGNQFDVFNYDPSDSTTVSNGSMTMEGSKYFEDSFGKIWMAKLENENLDCISSLHPNTYKQSSLKIDGTYDLKQHQINALGHISCLEQKLNDNDTSIPSSTDLETKTGTIQKFSIDGTFESPNLRTIQ